MLYFVDINKQIFSCKSKNAHSFIKWSKLFLGLRLNFVQWVFWIISLTD